MGKHKGSHKYKRIKYKTGFVIFRCVLPDCPHFLRKELLLNRRAICWRCESEFLVRNVEVSKPHCKNCTKDYKKPENEFSENVIDTLINTIGG